MTDRKPIFKVIVDAKGVVLVKVKRGRPGYRKARKRAILRQRDAIELFRKLNKAGKGKGFVGTYAFHLLETARTFAMLRLQARLREVQDNLDRVLTYDGSTKQSDG
ncbi:MAG: hypothetical protein HYY78_04745 [Betaproteobacteria bacterium]|nr:hypothetical protein [Betaproteobacteria bacterium]